MEVYVYTEYNERLDSEGLQTLVLKKENGQRIAQSYVPKRPLEQLTKEVTHLAAVNRIPVTELTWRS